ncbi:MAG: hypothetical protein AB7P69_01655 [Candidatus Binatia bacterium]
MKDLSHPWIWLVVFFLLFSCVPYFFVGTYEPLVFGAPLWFLSVLVASLSLTGFAIYLVFRHWRLAAILLNEKED